MWFSFQRTESHCTRVVGALFKNWVPKQVGLGVVRLIASREVLHSPHSCRVLHTALHFFWQCWGRRLRVLLRLEAAGSRGLGAPDASGLALLAFFSSTASLLGTRDGHGGWREVLAVRDWRTGSHALNCWPLSYLWYAMCELAGTSALFVSVLSTVQSLGADDVICFAMVFFGGGSDLGFERLTCGCRSTHSRF